MALWSLFRPAPPPFAFLDSGPLVDGELTLVPPDRRFVDEVLAAYGHPTTAADPTDLGRVTRAGLDRFLTAAAGGRVPPGVGQGYGPAYHFWMRVGPAGTLPDGLRMAGGVGLRIGDTPDLRRYVGHVGYNVYPFARGRRLAERAARLVLPIAKRHGLAEVWITCNPENTASHRTCQRLGGVYVDTVDVPRGHDLYARGERYKCRYRVDL